MTRGLQSPSGSSAGLVLAAGGSRRLGQPKQLLPVEGHPLLGLVLAKVCASDLDEVVLVLGAHAEEILAAVDLGRARIVVNRDYASGMSSSLRAGVEAMGDQPDISAVLIDELLDLQTSSGLPAAALRLGGMLHPPVVLDRSLWDDLRQLQGDVGCRAVIRGRPEQVAALPHVGRKGHPADIDTIDDYQQLIGAAD